MCRIFSIIIVLSVCVVGTALYYTRTKSTHALRRIIVIAHVSPTLTPTVTSTPTPTLTPTPQPPGLRVHGNMFYDGDRTILLKGVDRPSLEWDANGNNLSSQDYQLMRGWGANVVRVSLNQSFWRNDVNGYRARVAQNISWIEQVGMYVILDLHWSDRGNTGESTGGQQLMPDQNSLTFWKEVAAAYKNDGHVMFELYNEPHDISCDIWRDGGVTSEGWTAVGMQTLVDGIRAVGASNVVLIGGTNWAFDLSCVKTNRISGSNIAYATHPYNYPGKNTIADWDTKVGFLADTDPVVMTEFGDTQSKGPAGGDCQGNSAYVQNVLNWAKPKQISWTAWAWYPGTCEFPAIIKDWNGNPNASGQIVKQMLAQ